ncbi:uncharacterized protein LOC131224801 isoform X2 [Magnolia sinica]|uniref:uncharacterized protein LOC131224801 isoform X2 n=1 Tax=Magnolia sinica TaxID=86752 RepID=UPI002658B027|nr:uncharacterized protein LOC131224801 isoform X2 [Magnolia sinica]
MAAEQSTRRLQSRQYLGEISALCFLPLPHLSSSPFLLAGSGSQVLVYDVEAGKILNSFNVFEGVRVHGISCNFLDLRNCGPSATAAIKIAVFGERRVKLFSLQVEMTSDYQSSVKACVSLMLIHIFSKFNHWVMDVCFLKQDDMPCEHEDDSHLAVGLSDNSVCLWDISRSNMFAEVKCPERCLLYSMRLWGDNVKALRVASGTIYNEVIVWKLVQQAQSSASLVKASNDHGTSCFEDRQLCDQQYMAVPLSRLIGHEGSIFRIAWSSDGSKLMSVSDDRSARIWKVSALMTDSGEEACSFDVSISLTLFGHNARVWDCYISDSVIITAGEDCTCRVWGMDGTQLMVIREHIGRGIWRCLYDPSSSLLITAGFDSAIKVHPLNASSLGKKIDCDGAVKEFMDRTEIFTIHMPSSSEQLGLMDSKSEYVRCLRFAQDDVLYVATNHGYLYHVKLSEPGNVKWTELVRISEEVPIICMDLLSSNSSGFSKDAEDWIVVGDGKGKATVFRITDSVCAPKVALSFTWSAEKERQILGTYWCKSLGCSHLFTADPGGRLKLWRIDVTFADETCVDCEMSLIAGFTSCFGTRILCLDASFEEEVLVCGDQRGNLIMFPLSKGLLLATSIELGENIPSLAYFKGAHGISSVASIFIATLHFNQVEIRSTGGDGCVCYFKYDKDWRSLEFMGMKQVRELSLIQSVFANASSEEDLAHGNYAVGFASTDFIIWNLVNDTKILLVPCGGWRRPHSYFLGDVPEIQTCFAYLKDHTIHINRLWVPVSDRKLFPLFLHMQYHGREIHSLCFVSVGLQKNPNTESNCFHELSWVATGCEDGTVRLTSYNPSDVEGWSASKLLGKHVGGSAVRSICFVSEIYTTGQAYISCGEHRHDAIADRDDQFLLISVGAKRVLTSWLLQNKRHKEEALVQGAVAKTGNIGGPECPSMSFQWLSTHMPPKFASTRKSIENTVQNSGQGRNVSVLKASPTSRASIAKSKETESKLTQEEQNENDWRYMAVTAFLLKGADSRLTICFIVVACSDATLILRALLLPSRLWFDVALLVSQTSPVLALQHVVIPILDPSKDKVQVRSMYIVISGSTDGSIAFWDLTETVECFMQRVLTLEPEKLIECQRRPRTGRGSQGGRWWRSLPNRSAKKGPSDAMDPVHIVGDSNGCDVTQAAGLVSSELGSDHSDVPTISTQSTAADGFPVPEMQSDEYLAGVHEVWPAHIVNSVHQSGVNCLHVSNINDRHHSESERVYYVLSGGDDQALNCLGFDLALQPTNVDARPQQPTNVTNHVLAGMVREPTELGGTGMGSPCNRLRMLCNDRIASAHSSAVKGVWTDGTWVFSTGLDQRVRCWHLSKNGKLTEHSHLVISVPEPESLDARSCGRNQYQIAVAGRGMQMVKFSTSCDEDSKD